MTVEPAGGGNAVEREREQRAIGEAEELLARLPADMRRIVASLDAAFAARGHELYLVGGSVRDLLLGVPVSDLDFTTDAPPPASRAAGEAAGADAVYTVGEEFGTVGFVFGPHKVEITTYREEHYPTPDRRPAVRLGTDLRGDLSRRDFTINAMALDAAGGRLIDPFGGREDLRQGLIRAVGMPEERFNEDPLRILRALRFAAQLGFAIEPATFAAMRALGPELGRISRERVAAELNRLLVGPGAAAALAATREANLLPYILPEVVPMSEDTGEGRHKDIWEHSLRVVSQAPPRLAVRWAALLHDAAKPMTRSVDERGEVHFFGHEWQGANLARRALRGLKLDKALTERVSQLVLLHLRPAGYDDSWTDSAVRRIVVEAGDLLDDLLDLVAADVTSAREDRRREARRRVEGLREHIARLRAQHALDQLQSPLDGNELMAIFNRPPGKWIGELKDYLREMVIEGTLEPGDKVTALERANEWMAADQPR